jgi:Protein of unknown function (DUF2934)
MSDKTQRIRGRAYQLWQEQGEPEGKEAEHWLQAERELHYNGAGCASEDANEGEGSQTGSRAYDEATTAFAHSGKVAAAAADAVKALDNPADAAEMKAAERLGRRRSRGKDPALKE